MATRNTVASKPGKSAVDPLKNNPVKAGNVEKLGAVVEAKAGGKAKPGFKDYGAAKAKAGKTEVPIVKPKSTVKPISKKK